jgi:hypothetical protein
MKLGIMDGDTLFRLGMMLYDGALHEKALTVFELLAGETNSGAKSRYFWATVWQEMLLELMGRRADAVARYGEALDSGVDGTFRHSQYGIVITRAWVRQSLQEPYQRR